MSAKLRATAELKNDKMMFECEAGTNRTITDYTPPYGDGNGFMPLELFLVSLSSCMGGTIQFVAKSMQRNILSMKIFAEGERRSAHPTMFEHISIHALITSPDLTDSDMHLILEKAEDSLCPVSAMIKATVPISLSFELSKP